LILAAVTTATKAFARSASNCAEVAERVRARGGGAATFFLVMSSLTNRAGANGGVPPCTHLVRPLRAAGSSRDSTCYLLPEVVLS
jgi:hypothetical protein